jgi:hypothetical protein
VRERGVQTRRVRPGNVEPQKRPDPAPRPGTNVWQIIAIIALLAATAGWTTVAVIAIRPATTASVDGPVASDDPNAVDDTSPPPDSHEATALEALLPTALSGTPLDAQSWVGDSWLTMDPSLTSFLTSSGKTPPDLSVAQAYDSTGAILGTVGIYKVAGVDPAAVRDALLTAWKGDNSDMTTSTVTLGGEKVTKGDFGADIDASYLYVKDGAVYDIETSDEALAAAAMTAILHPGASAAPVTSAAPATSGSPAP